MTEKNTLMDQEAIKNLSAKQKVSQWIEKLSRSYRDKIQKARWIENAIRSVEKRKKKGLIEENLSRICREVVKLEEKVLSNKGKTHRDECNKQATQT